MSTWILVLIAVVLFLAMATLKGLSMLYGDPAWWKGREREIPLYALLWPLCVYDDIRSHFDDK